jgi:hypothetical protein
MIGDGMSKPRQRLLQMFFEAKARMVGADRDSHIADCTVRFQAS